MMMCTPTLAQKYFKVHLISLSLNDLYFYDSESYKWSFSFQTFQINIQRNKKFDARCGLMLMMKVHGENTL